MKWRGGGGGKVNEQRFVRISVFIMLIFYQSSLFFICVSLSAFDRMSKSI